MTEHIKPLNLMSVEELTRIITKEKDNYNEEVHEKVVAELESRGITLSDLITKVKFQKNHEAELILGKDEALELFENEISLLDVLYINNFMSETLVIQKGYDYWIIHHFSEKSDIKTGFLTNDIKPVIEKFILLEDWQADLSFHAHWETLIESNSVKHILKASELLNDESITHIINSRNLIRFVNQNAAYSIIVLSENAGESEDALEKFENLKTDLYKNLEIAEADNDVDEQLKILGELEAVTPDDPALFYNKAQLLTEKGEIKEASDALIDSFNIELENGNVEDLEETENYLKDCLDKVEDKNNILHCLASIASFRGEVEDAFDFYKQIVNISEDDIVAHLNLGHLYYSHTEEDNKAKFHFEKYLQLDPDSSDRESIESILENL
ncbi:MAG: hypothetical protein JEY94_13070 [Melioribacteraceae bacterium]|nr:hypothetical protein [Melioribacteraceae bacterium]